MALVIALAIGGTALNRSADQNPGPIDRPRRTPTRHRPQPARSSTATTSTTIHVGTIHVGDHLVDIDQRLPTRGGWDLALTDAGVVYGKSDGLWFTDGGAPRRIA